MNQLSQEQALILNTAENIIHKLDFELQNRGKEIHAKWLLQQLSENLQEQGGKQFIYKVFPVAPISTIAEHLKNNNEAVEIVGLEDDTWGIKY